MKRFFVLVTLVLLTACSNKPNDELIAIQVSQRLEQRLGSEIVEVINFSKVNGIPRDNNTYFADVEYDLRFRVDLEDATARLQRRSGSIFAAGVETAALGMMYGNFRAGDIHHKKERVRFVRSEKGWLLMDEEP